MSDFRDGLGAFAPKGFREDEEEIPDIHEKGALEVFGLGPARLDLEHSAAAKEIKKYQPQPERMVNTIVVIARKLYLDGVQINAENIIKEWDTTVSLTPDLQYVRTFMRTREFKNKMALVGAEVTNGLTAVQLAVITTLTFPDGKSLPMKLKKHKIPWVTFQGWLKNPKFLEHLKLTAEQALTAAEVFSLIQLVNQASSGSPKAMDTVLAMTGRWDPNNRKQVDAQKMVSIILQVLDEEVTDPALKARIGNRLSVLSSSAAVADSSTLQGELNG